ncbi:MAG: flagellar assembly protein FliW [Spirochaetales bacterium]
MTIETKAYGEVEIDERQLISFPVGLFGFEHLHRFALIDAHQHPFYWLQSIEEVDVAFVLLNPLVFRPDYTLDAPKTDIEALEAEDHKDLLVFSIVTIPEDERQMTANLQGPLVIHRRKRIGRQIISMNPKWMIRHNIHDELARMRSDAC